MMEKKEDVTSIVYDMAQRNIKNYCEKHKVSLTDENKNEIIGAIFLNLYERMCPEG